MKRIKLKWVVLSWSLWIMREAENKSVTIQSVQVHNGGSVRCYEKLGEQKKKNQI